MLMRIRRITGILVFVAVITPLLAAVAAPAQQCVVDRLMSLGLSAEQAQSRVAQMSEAELEQLAAEPGLLLVGGTIQGDETDTLGPVGHGKRTAGTLMDNVYENLLGWDRPSSQWNARYWTVSAGGVWLHERVNFPGFGLWKDQDRYGGFLAAEYYPTPAFSIEPAITVIDAMNLNGTVGGTNVHLSAVSVSLGVEGKLHLFKLAGPKDFPLQPYLLAGVRGVFYDSSASVNSVIVDDSPLGSMAVYRVGGGTNIKLGKKWFGRIDVTWYDSISSADVTIPGIGSSGMDTHGWFVTAGAGMRF
jgi:outer membrane protein W